MVDDIDAKRVSYFTASGKRDRSLCLDGLKHEMCTKTDGEGLIEQQFQVTNDDIEQFRVPGGVGGKVEYSVSTVDKSVQAKGEIFLCDDQGISFISDIVSDSIETSNNAVDFFPPSTGRYHQNHGCDQRSSSDSQYICRTLSRGSRYA